MIRLLVDQRAAPSEIGIVQYYIAYCSRRAEDLFVEFQQLSHAEKFESKYISCKKKQYGRIILKENHGRAAGQTWEEVVSLLSAFPLLDPPSVGMPLHLK